MKKTPKNGNGTSGVPDEAVVEDLRKTLNSLDTTIAIYKNDMERALKSLQDKYGVNSIEEALGKADSINQEMAQLEKSKGALLAKIKVAMQKYSNEAMGA